MINYLHDILYYIHIHNNFIEFFFNLILINNIITLHM
jgi:hypothetical protein